MRVSGHAWLVTVASCPGVQLLLLVVAMHAAAGIDVGARGVIRVRLVVGRALLRHAHGRMC